MAKLCREQLTLEVLFLSFESGWIVYDIRWLWEAEPILNDAVLKRSSDYWNTRSNGGMHANEYRADYFIKTIEGVLESETAACFETTDPDVILAVYPGFPFPFITSDRRVIWESDAVKQEQANRAKRKAELGKLPDDYFTLMFFVSAYTFRGCSAYPGDGLSLHMIVRRDVLEKFCAELRADYFAFKRQWQVDEFAIQDIGVEDARKLPLFGDGTAP